MIFAQKNCFYRVNSESAGGGSSELRETGVFRTHGIKQKYLGTDVLMSPSRLDLESSTVDLAWLPLQGILLFCKPSNFV